MKLTLWFYGSTHLELYRSSFSLQEETRLCVRGKSQGSFSAHGTFQWTPAVQALSTLLLRSVYAKREGRDEPVGLYGESGTPASSLDYALSKEPRWLLEMFGWDDRGKAMLRRYIRRTNPERKLPGPVRLCFSKEFLQTCSIEIVLNDLLVVDQTVLHSLIESVEYGGRSKALSQKSYEDNLIFKNVDSTICKIISSEIYEMLFKTDIFSKEKVLERLHRIQRNPSFQKLTPKSRLLINELDFELTPSERIGIDRGTTLLRTAFTPDRPLRVALPATLPASIAIFQYLKHVKGYNIEIDYQFVHAIEIMKKIIHHQFINPPDACVLGIAPAGTLLSQQSMKEYSSLMMMPMMSHRVVSKKGKKRRTLNGGSYLFLREDPSTASFYFDDLLRTEAVEKKTVSIEHYEPDDTFSLFNTSEEDLKAVLFFPHHQFNFAFNGCDFLDRPDAGLHYRESLLFVHRRIQSEPLVLKYLDIAIRDAWLQLKLGGEAAHSIIKEHVCEPQYLNFLTRFTGLHNLRSVGGSSNVI